MLCTQICLLLPMRHNYVHLLYLDSLEINCLKKLNDVYILLWILSQAVTVILSTQAALMLETDHRL